MTKLSMSFLLATVFVLLAGCSDITGTAVTSTAPTAGVIALGKSANFILTGNATTATLTATLVDSSNAFMPGVAISFSATTGNLSASTATTDANGQATVTLRSGLSDYSNRTATVTASVGGQSASVQILIKGSTLALALASNSIQVGAGTITATATATDATAIGTSGQTIRFSIGATSTGAGTLSATTLTTDGTGVTPSLTFTPTVAGTVVLTAEWLNSAGVVTVATNQNIIVTSTTGVAFAITIPVANPLALATAPTTQPLAVTVPASIGTATVASVRISATSGSWTGTNPVTTSTSIQQTPSAGAVAAIYTAPPNSGSVTVQVDALDASGATLSSLTRTFAISAPSTAAAQIMLNASKSTIGPSFGSNISTSTLKAVVRDVNSNTVGGAAVMFGLLGTTGSGETVSPAVVYTDSQGMATTTFSAGTSSTLAAIHAQASIVGQVCAGTLPDPVSTETNKLCDATPLRVSSDAVSITVNFGTTIVDAANSTQYQLPGSVLVVDSNGSPAAGATVTLTAFPAKYRNGSIYPVGFWTGSAWQIDCGGPFVATSGAGPLTSFTDNEDINRNGILDDGTLAPAEDTTLAQAAMSPWIAALAIPNNGLISPAQAAGGAVPMTLTTDSTGSATFYLQYPKSSAWFIEDEVTARVIVSGTESTGKINYILPMSAADAADDICIIGRTASY